MLLLIAGLICLVVFLIFKIRLIKEEANSPHRPIEEKHPEQRYSERIAAQKAAATNPAPAPYLDWMQNISTEVPTVPPILVHSVDATELPIGEATEPVELKEEQEPKQETYIGGYRLRVLPHLKPALYIVCGAIIWILITAWYNNLSRYMPPSANALGDFRILFLKKAVGALTPCLSAVFASILMFFSFFPKIYNYLNGWTSKGFDLYTDLQNIEQTGPARRVMFFCFLFTLFFLAFLHFFPLSLADLTL
ncbi:hypothetical protein [Tellurirhabdus bombi]|uniref:hypothetical protein n=1 Tax=Tellurirhabdus bombi TaxID=2907205 RepID=UPI001F21AE73|nr:hypothetical protein [Tellurirhabdus bombi]